MRRRAELLTCSDDLINSKIVFGCIFYHLVSLVSPSQYLAFIEPQKQTIVVIIITSKEEEEEGRKKNAGKFAIKWWWKIIKTQQSLSSPPLLKPLHSRLRCSIPPKNLEHNFESYLREFLTNIRLIESSLKASKSRGQWKHPAAIWSIWTISINLKESWENRTAWPNTKQKKKKKKKKKMKKMKNEK